MPAKKKAPVKAPLKDEIEKFVDERPAQGAALKHELEAVEGFPGEPNITAREATTLTVETPDHIATATATLPARGDEGPRTVTVRLIADANGTDSRLTIEGVGVGGHSGYTRVWPDDQLHLIEFDGDTYSQTLGFVATHGLVVIDESDEIRAGEPADRKDTPNG